ncbi:MAG: cupin domain-containing protein [Vicinamibacterales bacterium]
MMTDDLQALVMADAIGALDEDEQRTLQEQLSALSVDEREAVARLYDTALLIAASAMPEEPPPHVREQVLSARSGAPSTYTVTASAAWVDSGHPGISSAKILALDRTRGLVTMLLKGERGAIYPSHRHSTPEECYVVRGSISIGDLVLRAGDFHHADTDSEHDEILVLEPAEVMLVGAIADYLPH